MKKLGFEEDICDRKRHKQLRFSYNDVLWTELWRKNQIALEEIENE